jgi:hypothetical protein
VTQLRDALGAAGEAGGRKPRGALAVAEQEHGGKARKAPAVELAEGGTHGTEIGVAGSDAGIGWKGGGHQRSSGSGHR